MDDRTKIIEVLKSQLQQLEHIHAMWLEGSLAEKDSDDYSDLDIWFSVDDDKLRSIFDDIEQVLETIAPIDFKFVLKPNGELGHNVYHLEGMSEFISLDINTQRISRNIVLTEGVDIHETIFDKSGVIRTKQRDVIEFNKEIELAELLKFIDYSALSVKKNTIREKRIESREYYRNILIHVLEYLRKKASVSEKVDFGFKHMYKDIPNSEAKKIEEFYFSIVDDEVIKSLKSWLESI